MQGRSRTTVLLVRSNYEITSQDNIHTQMNKLMEGKFIFVVRCAIWYHLYNFVQVLKKKKFEKERGGNFPYLFKVAFVCNATKF